LKSMAILITGKNGQVGGEFARLYRADSAAVLVGRDECDLSSESSIRDTVRRVRPRVIVNAAAYTAVDLAEKERAFCFAINAEAPRVLAEEAARLDALLVHYSTDYVFDGANPEPYVEADPTNPMSVYGESKLAGEAAIVASGSRHLILRTSWVYAAHGKNFLRTMLRLGAERPELRVVDDQVGAPTSAAAIAAATARLLQQDEAPSGIYHMTAGGSTSWYGFACAIFGSGVLPSAPRVEAIASSEYPTPARRPAHSTLSNDKFAGAFGFRLTPWQQQLQEVIAGMTEMNGAIR
jgi:dTDP-4-dehydrorhamnose reductase